MKILQLDKNHPLIVEQLSAKGFELDEDFQSTYEEILKKIEKYEGIILRSRIPIDQNFIEHATNPVSYTHLDVYKRQLPTSTTDGISET